MVPIDKVKDIINKYDALEKELSLGNMDPKLYVKKSKEYGDKSALYVVKNIILDKNTYEYL